MPLLWRGHESEKGLYGSELGEDIQTHIIITSLTTTENATFERDKDLWASSFIGPPA